MEIQIDIGKDWFEKTKQDFIKEYNDDRFTEDKDKMYRISFDIDKNHDTLVHENGDVVISGGDNDIFINAKIRPDIESLVNLSGIVAKYYNKAKTVFEGLK